MKTVDREKLWEEYQKKKTPELREKLIIEYSPLVKLVAGRLSMYLGYNVEYDDLVSYGIFGLIDAIDKFDLGKEVKFETYASLRIRGTILDQIRKMDWIPRTVRQKQKKIDEAIKQVEMRTGKKTRQRFLLPSATPMRMTERCLSVMRLFFCAECGTLSLTDTARNSGLRGMSPRFFC